MFLIKKKSKSHLSLLSVISFYIKYKILYL